tara:strand:- start:1492 stop:2262 length:771 start_codon:yes stop_codon:yes gene_type:complete
MNFRLKLRCSFIGGISAITVYGTLATEAAADICADITINNCPTLFREECIDTEFRNANVNACFNAITDIGDADFCASAEASACTPNPECDAMLEPIDRYFCVKNQNECPTNVGVLSKQYDEVLTDLNASLARYQELTGLELGEADTLENLCAFPLAELESLQEQSLMEIATIETSERSIGSIDQCATTLQSFIDQGAPPNFPEETWDLIASAHLSGTKQVEIVRGRIQGNIESLKEAPEELSSLRTAYRIICPQDP